MAANALMLKASVFMCQRLHLSVDFLIIVNIFFSLMVFRMCFFTPTTDSTNTKKMCFFVQISCY